MIFQEHKNYFTKEKSYEIKIEYDDDVEPFDLAECFKFQYPMKICVLTYKRIITMEGGLILIGLKLPVTEVSRK